MGVFVFSAQTESITSTPSFYLGSRPNHQDTPRFDRTLLFSGGGGGEQEGASLAKI